MRLGLLLLALAAPTPAFAQQRFVALGPVFSGSGHLNTPIQFGLGLEATYVHYDRSKIGRGMFLHFEWIGFDHFRFGAGPQLNIDFAGAELGLVLETTDGRGNDTTLFIHLGPFASVGVASASGRFDVPVFSADAACYGLGLGGAIALKYVQEIRNGKLREPSLTYE